MKKENDLRGKQFVVCFSLPYVVVIFLLHFNEMYKNFQFVEFLPRIEINVNLLPRPREAEKK